jgi:hypothetical protein
MMNIFKIQLLAASIMLKDLKSVYGEKMFAHIRALPHSSTAKIENQIKFPSMCEQQKKM